MNLPAIGPLDSAAQAQAQKRWDSLTKPLGSLGRLEELGTRLAGMTGQVPPPLSRKVIFTVAADHGVVEEGVSAYPQAVTAQMVLNFIQEGAGINVLARLAGAEVIVVDAGVASEIAPTDRLISVKSRRGTANFAREPAMSRKEGEEIVRSGIDLFRGLHQSRPIHCVGLGDMGIGNTTASSALVCALTGTSAHSVTGRGTGISEEGLLRKARVIEAALSRHRPDPRDPLDCLAKVGGLEIGCLAGIALAAAESRVPVVLDGFITSAAALLAFRLNPGVRDYLVASHRSVEPGHGVILRELNLTPLFDLGMRLGEGTGAALGFILLEASVRLMKEMATFQEAGVSEKTP